MKNLGLLLLIFSAMFAQAKQRHSSKLTVFPPTKECLVQQNLKINQMGLERIIDEHRLAELVNSGKLVALLPSAAIDIAPSLPPNRRYVLPMTRDLVLSLASAYHAEFGLPLQIDSAVRPKSVQRKLRRWNKSAAPVDGEAASSHEAGTTVDLSRRMTKRQLRWLEWRLLYYYGCGLVLVEEEKHCIHLMVTKENDDNF